MTLEEIKTAVDAGGCVCWKNGAYRVIRDNIGQYLIGYAFTGPRARHYIGLTHADGVTLNGNPEDFYIAESIRGIPAT